MFYLLPGSEKLPFMIYSMSKRSHMMFTNIASPPFHIYCTYSATLFTPPSIWCVCVSVARMIAGCGACATTGPIISIWQPHYSAEGKMNATCQRTVNCVSGCVDAPGSKSLHGPFLLNYGNGWKCVGGKKDANAGEIGSGWGKQIAGMWLLKAWLVKYRKRNGSPAKSRGDVTADRLL